MFLLKRESKKKLSKAQRRLLSTYVLISLFIIFFLLFVYWLSIFLCYDSKDMHSMLNDAGEQAGKGNYKEAIKIYREVIIITAIMLDGESEKEKVLSYACPDLLKYCNKTGGPSWFDKFLIKFFWVD